MLDWIIANKAWLFEGIGVVVLTAIVGWLWSKKGKNEGQSEAAAPDTGPSVQQINVNGDNVGRDKIIKG